MNEREELRKWLVEIISQGGWVDQHEVDVKGQVNAIYDYVVDLINSEVLSVLEELDKSADAMQTYKIFEDAEDILIERKNVKLAIQSIKNRYKEL